MQFDCFRRMTVSTAGVVALLAGAYAGAQSTAQATSDERWYQIEVTVFAHENAMQAQELWPLEILEQPLPAATRRLDHLTDVLSLPEWRSGAGEATQNSTIINNNPLTENSLPPELPETAVPLHNSDFRLPDTERDAFLALPASAHGFTDTNRALATSGRYQVMYHDAWRQPLTTSAQAAPLWISGGQVFGDRHELEGTLTVRFNPGRDRVVLDARLWLTQFSTMPAATDQAISLPALPGFVINQVAPAADTDVSIPAGSSNPTQWYATRVIPVINSRDMRSNEFHYLDHPAVGIVVHVFPYTVPPLPEDAAALL